MRIVQLTCILLALLLVLLQKIDITVKKSEQLCAQVDFALLSVTFSQGKKRRGLNDTVKLLRNASPFFKTAKFLLSHSSVDITLSHPAHQSPEMIIRAIPIAISFPAVLSYLANNAKSLTYSANTITDCSDADGDNLAFSILFSFNFLFLIISALLLLYYKSKSLLRRN